MAISDDVAMSALMRQEFSFFLRHAFAEIRGGGDYQHNWHIDAIEHQLDRIRQGENRRLIVTMPPRHLKSIAITTAWVAWMLGHHPGMRFMCLSYGAELSAKYAQDCKTIMESAWYRRAFPNTRLVRKSVMDFDTTAGGGRFSTSIGGVVTGRGADVIIIDDPLKAEDALSEVRRGEVIDWFFTTLVSRLDDQLKSSIILVMQRLHEADLAGELIRRGGWQELRLAAIATSDELIPLPRGRTYQRREGHPLDRVRMPLSLLEAKRADEPYVFAAHHQQDPVSRIGAFVQADWFGTYDEPPHTGTVMQSWDTANKVSVRSDWSVGITARFYQGRFYILDVFRKKVEFGELLRTVKSTCLEHDVTHLLIEDAASGQQLIQQLREDADPGVVLPIPMRPTSDKIVRFEAQAGRIQAGTVVLPRAAPWLADFMAELVGFPNARHDDQADALAQLMSHQPIELPEIAAPELMDPYYRYDGDYDLDPWA